MKEYLVSYHLDDFFHCYTIEAENEFKAIEQVMNRISEGSQKIFKDFKIARKKVEW